METPPAKGESPTRAILSQMASTSFEMLWTGLEEALEVIEGVVGGNEPDRFGALIRGYLMYLHLMDHRVALYNGEKILTKFSENTFVALIFPIYFFSIRSEVDSNDTNDTNVTSYFPSFRKQTVASSHPTRVPSYTQ